jgi:hypothetical protein
MNTGTDHRICYSFIFRLSWDARWDVQVPQNSARGIYWRNSTPPTKVTRMPKAPKSKDLQPFTNWIGEWTGRGQTLKEVPITTRMEIRSRLAGEVLDFEIQSLHAENGNLVHGVAGLMATDPDGERRMAVSSTIHGTISMTLTPEDPDAGAIEGVSVTGNRVVVSLVQEDGGLMLTSYWKTPSGEQVGFTNVKLKRVKK